MALAGQTFTQKFVDEAAELAGNAANYISGGGNMLLVDFETFKPPEELRVKLEDGGDNWWHGAPSSEAAQFHNEVFKKSGLSDDGTYLPKNIHPKYCDGKPQTDLTSSMAECKMAVCGAMDGLLKKMKMHPDDVNILLTTCSVFCPTPSMASMVLNTFKMGKRVQSYHLGGMGCANGVIAVNLIRDLLQAHPNSNAVLICHETVTTTLYAGKDKHRMVPNVMLRMGASAILFSNKKVWRSRGKAKYALESSCRVHAGVRDEAYRSVQYSPDDENLNGIYLGPNVIAEATGALTAALKKIGPKILTTGQLLGGAWQYTKDYLGVRSVQASALDPCFAQGVQHFLIHAGGAKVLDGVGGSLSLAEDQLEPSRAVLRDYGNVSSSTTWYALAFLETIQGVRKGDRVLQIGVGSGIKCGVNIWKALKSINDTHLSWEHRVPEQRRVQLGTHRPHAGLGAILLLMAILIALAAWLFVTVAPVLGSR